MNHRTAIIFDLDGTLINTLADIARAMNAVLQKHGLPEHPVRAYASMVGWGLRVLVDHAVERNTIVDRETLAAELHDEYHAHPYDFATPYPGIIDLLTALSQQGIQMAVHSNKAHSLCHTIVDATIGAHWFAAIEGRREDRPAKPDPAGALSVAQAFGVDAADVVFVGDSAIDIETAKNAGMMPVGVAWGFRSRDELAAAGAAAIVQKPEELLPIVQSPVF